MLVYQSSLQRQVDLEARGEIARTTGSGSQRIRLVKWR